MSKALDPTPETAVKKPTGGTDGQVLKKSGAAVVWAVDDTGAITLPLAETNLASTTQTALAKARTSVQTVGGKGPGGAGDLTLTAADVGALAPPPGGIDGNALIKSGSAVTWGSVSGAAGDSVFRRNQMRLNFEPIRDTPIITAANINGFNGNIYYFNIFLAEGRLANPLGKYYGYFSTDHSTGSGGVWLAYANDLAGPWSMYSTSPVFVDGSNQQTETPSVVWEPLSEQIYMYYHNNTGASWGSAQRSYLATSEDGISFTKYGTSPIWDIVQNDYPTAGHLGYGQVARLSTDRWVAVHLNGGSGISFSSVSFAHDGVVWHVDPSLVGDLGEHQGRQDRRWGIPYLFLLGDRVWGLVADLNIGSGTDMRTARMCAAPMTADLRNFLYPPETAWSPTKDWERNASAGPVFVDADGTPYFTMTCDRDVGIWKGSIAA